MLLTALTSLSVECKCCLILHSLLAINIAKGNTILIKLPITKLIEVVKLGGSSCY